MKVPSKYKKIVIDDFNFAAEMMRKSEYPEEKLFYYSSTHGTLLRILNLEYTPEMLFAHFVFNHSYASVAVRMNSLKTGDRTVDFPAQVFDKLADAVGETAKRIEQDKDLWDIYQKIAELSHISTGNGFYLLKKGIIKI